MEKVLARHNIPNESFLEEITDLIHDWILELDYIMKMQDLEGAFNEGFHRFGYLITAHETFGAMAELAALENCLPRLSRELQDSWSERINNQNLSETVVQRLKFETQKEIDKVRRVLAYGTKWEPEELLLIWTRRIEIELVIRMMSERGQFSEYDFFLEDIDQDMFRIAKSKANKSGVQLAISLIKKNRGLPIRSRWLEIAF